MKVLTCLLTVLAATLGWTGHGFGQSGELYAPEQLAMSDTIQYALENNPTNQSSDWVNPDTGNSGGIVPIRTFTGGQQGPCREFISTIVIGGEQQQGYGTACRQPDGTWQLVADPSTSVRPPPPAAQTHIYITHPPPQYYYYPADFYGPYRIYLSFGYVYRGGYAYRGSYFLDGRSFRHRHPIHVRERIYISPRDLGHRHWFDHRHGERIVERSTIPRAQERQQDRVWRDRDRGDARRVWKERDRDRDRGDDRRVWKDRSRGNDQRDWKDRGRGDDSRGGRNR